MIIFLQATTFVNTEGGEWSCEICKHLVTKHAGNLRKASDSRAKRVHFAASFHDISIEFSRLFACFRAFTRICMCDTEPAHLIASHFFSYSWRISISAQLRENFRANSAGNSAAHTRMLELFWNSEPQIGVKEVSRTAPSHDVASRYIFSWCWGKIPTYKWVSVLKSATTTTHGEGRWWRERLEIRGQTELFVFLWAEQFPWNLSRRHSQLQLH